MAERFSGGEIWRLFNHRPLTPGECQNFAAKPNGILSTELDPVFDDYLVSGLELALGANAPDLAELRDGLFLLAFAGTGVTVEQGFFSVHILHGIQANTNPTMHVHWTHNQAAPSGNVKWNIDYSIAKGYSVDTFAAPTSLSVVQTAAAQYTHHISDDDDMIITDDIEPDSVLIGRIYRDPADAEDTFEADAFLVQADLHYLRSRIGTTDRNRPYDGF